MQTTEFIIKHLYKAIIIPLVFTTLLFSGCRFLIGMSLGAYDKDYSVTDLKNNFNLRKAEITDLKKYYQEIVPRNRLVDIEITNKREIDRLEISLRDTRKIIFKDLKQNSFPVNYYLNWNLKTNSGKTDSIIGSLGWTRETIQTLKKKLDAAGCISISNGAPVKIGFKRCGMGMYFFNVFEQPIPNDLITKYNDSCTYIYVNEYLVLEYGGGAIGPQCFYNLE